MDAVETRVAEKLGFRIANGQLVQFGCASCEANAVEKKLWDALLASEREVERLNQQLLTIARDRGALRDLDIAHAINDAPVQKQKN